MKKLLIMFAACFFSMTSFAQWEKIDGVWTYKDVAYFEGVSANELYVRALEGLSELVGSESKAKFNIDVQDKEAALVIFKGTMDSGIANSTKKYAFHLIAELTVRIKCKDGRAQITITTPTMLVKPDANNRLQGDTQRAEFTKLYPECKSKLEEFNKNANIALRSYPNKMTLLYLRIVDKMSKNEDDF